MVTNGPQQITKTNVESVNIKLLIFKYLRYWYLFVGSIILCLVLAKLHTLYNTTSQHYISSTLLIKNDKNNNALSGGISGGMENLSASKNIGNEIVILKSKSLMQRVLKELSLHASYYVESRFKNIEVYKDDLPISVIISKLETEAFGKLIKVKIMDNNNFRLIEYDQKGEEIKSDFRFGQEINRPYATFTILSSSDFDFSKDIIIIFNDINQLADHFSNSLIIHSENKESNVLRLSLIDPVPERSISIINKLIEVYNREAIEDKNQVDVNTIEFLDERIKFLSSELSNVEINVEKYKQQNNLTDVSSNAQIYFETASEYSKDLNNYELQLDLITSLEQYLDQKEIKLVPSSMNIPDPTLNGLIAKYNELQLERQRMLRTIQPNSSLLLNMDDQIQNLRINIIENLKNIKNGLMITYNNLKSSSAQFQSKIRRVPSLERELLEINRQQSVKQAIYLFLLQRREEAGVSLASSSAISRIIDTATAYPISPKKSSIYLAAIILGFLFPFAFLYIKFLLNDNVTEKKDIEQVLDIPILGEIFRGENKNVLQITAGNNSIIAETFRLVRTNLNFASMGKENKVILITSSRSGEGKTFFAINLGSSLAISGKKVVVLNFDLRKPKSMQALGIDNKVGITNYLISENLQLESLLVPVGEIPGLHIIGSGPQPPNPAELMMNIKVQQLIEELKLDFDYIIIDTPPVGQVADAYNLAPYIDSTIYIVRYDYSSKIDLSIISDIYLNKKLKKPMIVLNDAQKKNGYKYGYGYRYGARYNEVNAKEKIENIKYI